MTKWLHGLAGARRLACRALLPAAALAAFLFLVPGEAHAATFTVDTTLDATYAGCLDGVPNDCSLRDAVDKANANPGPDTIVLPPGIYRLIKAPAREDANAGGDLDITDDITIMSASGDPTNTIIQSGSVDTLPHAGFDRILSINPNWNKVVNATIRGVTLRYGVNPGVYNDDGYGGAIDMESTPFGNASIPGEGSLTIDNCIITHNATTQADGGGISVIRGIGDRTGGLLTITNSEISHNKAVNGNGGGIQTNIPFSITGTTIKSNSSEWGGARGGYGGGVIATKGGSITNSTVSGNTLVTQSAGNGHGAGLYVSGGLTATNVTLSGNSGGTRAAAITLGGTANTLTNLTITGNTSTDGSAIWMGTGDAITLNNSIVWGNSILGGTVSGSNNLIGTNPLIGPLANNGGRVMTHALQPGSPAIDAGNNGLTAGASTDARGFARIVDGDGNGTATVDIGAFEAEAPSDLTISFPGGTFTQGQTDAAYTITVTNVGSAGSSGTITVNVTLGAGLNNPRLSGPGWTCNNGTRTCTRSDSLAANASYPITLLVDVLANAPVTVSHSATVSGDANTANNTAATTSTIRQTTTTTVSAASATYGDPVTLSASVTTGVAGTVQFSATGLGVIGTATVNTATGAATATAPGPFAAGAYPLTATFTPSDANWAASSGSSTLTINKAPLTVTAVDQAKTYGGANPALTATYTGFKLGQTQSVLGGSLTLSTTATASSSVGTYPITGSGYTSPNYNITYVSGILTVNPAPLTVTAEAKTKPYGSPNPTLTVTYAGFVLGDTAAIITGTPAISTAVTDSTTPGAYPITVSGYAAPNYTVTHQNGTLTVAPAPLTVRVDDASRTYGAANPTFTATYDGFVLGQTEAQLSGTLALTTTATAASPVGPYPITGSGIASSNYTITYDAGTLTVTPAPLTITADDQSRIYGAADPAFTFTPAGLVNGDTATVITGAPSFSTTATLTSSPGTYPISVSGLSAANYTIAYQNGTLTVTQRPLTVTADSLSRAYGAANPALTVSLSGFATGEDASDLGGTLSVTTAATATSPVGTYPIAALGYTSTNYAITFAPGVLTVTPAPLTITADNASRTYGADNPTFAATYTGLVAGDDETDLTGTLSLATTASASSPVGTYPITVGGVSNANYTIAFVNGTLTVTPAPLTVTADDATRAYGAANPTFTATYSGFVLGENEIALTGTLSFAAPGALAGVGEHAITPSGLSATNYAVSYVDGTLTVTPAPVVVTADNATRTYGAADPVFTATYTGLMNGETPAALGLTPGFATTAVAGSSPGDYDITVSGLSAANYSFSYQPGTLSVTPAPLTVTAAPAARTYGAPDPAFAVSYAGFVLGQNESVLGGELSFSTTATATSTPGTYSITPAGLTSTNYAITFVAGPFTVSQRSLTVTAADSSKVYGDANPAFTATYDGFAPGEDDGDLTGPLSFTTAATAASAAGTYPVTPAGLTSANYAITFVPGTLTVDKKALTVTTNDASKVYGDANPAFTVSYDGFVLGQNESVLTGSLIMTTAATASSPVGTYDVTPSGLTAANYAITFAKGTLTVTPKSLTVTADPKSKVYGQPNPAFAVSYSGLVAGDTAADLTGPLVFDPIDEQSGAGSYDILPSGLSSPNYTITFAKGTLTITPAPLTVTANDKSKVYGEANPTFDVAYGAFQWSDGPAQLTGPLAFAPIDERSGAGSYDILPSGLNSPNYTITFAKGTLTITPAPLTVTANDKSKVYGEANPTFDVAYGAFQWDDDAGDLTGPTTFTPIDEQSGAGSYDIIPAGLSSPNYTITFVKGTLTISPAPLTVTANDKSKVYGEANPTFDVVYGAFQWSDGPANLTGPLAFAPVEERSGAGSYDLIPSGLSSPNYDITFVKGTLTVTPAALTVTAADQSMLYGGTVPAFTVSYAGFQWDDDATDLGGSLTYGTIDPASSAGSYDIVPAGLSSPNYTITFVKGTLTVAKAPLTVTADDKIRVFGDANPALTASYTGFVLGETEAVLGGTLTLTTTATPASMVGTYPITAAGLTSANYEITFVPGTLTVTNATLTVRAVDASRLYGDPNPAFTVTYTGFVGGDTAATLTGTLALATTATQASPAGTYAITPSGVSAANYVVVFEPGTLTVTPRPLYVSADSASRPYGDANPSLSGSVSGAVNGDVIRASYSTTATVTSPVGTYPISASAHASTGSLSNYNVRSSGGVLTVTKAPLTIQVGDASRTYGEANPTFQAAMTGVKNNDQITVAFATTATADSAVGTYPITGQVQGDTPNYAVTMHDGKLTVTPATLTVTAEDATKTEGEQNPPLKGEVVGVRPGDAIHATFRTTATRESEPGTYPITADLRDPRNRLGNYTVTIHEGTLTVTACDISHGNDQGRAVSRTSCRSSATAEAQVLEALGNQGGESTFLVLATEDMVKETISNALGEAAGTPPRLIMQAGEAEVSGGIISLSALNRLSLSGGELEIQTSQGSLLLPARLLQPLARGAADSRLVILFANVPAAPPTTEGHQPGSPLVDITVATLLSDGSVAEHGQFAGNLVLRLPVDGSLDLELAGIYHVTEDAEGNPEGLSYMGGEADGEAGVLQVESDHLSMYAVLLLDREYDDVPSAHWAHRAVKVMSARHVVRGTGDNLFAPDRSVTRAEYATMMARSFGIRPLPVVTRSFADVAPDAWHAGIMQAVVEAGLFTPEAGNTLRPDVPITREEMAVVIARAMERFSPQPALDEATVDQVLSRFVDQGLIAPENRDELASLVAAGLVNGRAADTLAPHGTTTRAEAVTLIKRLLDWVKAHQ